MTVFVGFTKWKCIYLITAYICGLHEWNLLVDQSDVLHPIQPVSQQGLNLCLHACFPLYKNGCVYLLWKQSFKPYDCSIVHHVKTGELHAALTTVTSLIVLLLHERFLKWPFIPHKSKDLKTLRVSFLKRLSSVALLCNT